MVFAVRKLGKILNAELGRHMQPIATVELFNFNGVGVRSHSVYLPLYRPGQCEQLQRITPVIAAMIAF